MFDVIGIESPCLDFPINLDSLPKSNGGLRLNDYSWQGGGKVSTGMIAAARLGAKCCQIGAVGDDIFGRACYADFKRHGVDVSHMLIRKNSTTPLSVVMSDLETRGRSIMYKQGSAAELSADEVPFELIKDAKFFFLAFFGDNCLRAAKLARENGVKVLMDADGYSDVTMRNIGLVDYFIASEFVYDYLFKDSDYEKNCRAVKAMGPAVVVFTLGAAGCVGVDEHGRFFSHPTFEVPVVDTLGAGDVFHGAFLAGLLRGWSAEQTALFANAVSSIKCTRGGGRAGIPDMPTVLRFMETGEIDYTDIDRRVEEYRRGLELPSY